MVLRCPQRLALIAIVVGAFTLEACRENAQHTLALADRLDERQVLALEEAKRGSDLLILGRAGESVSHLEKAVAGIEGAGYDQLEVSLSLLLCAAYLSLGTPPATWEATLERARRVSERSNFAAGRVMVRLTDAWQRHRAGKISDGELNAAVLAALKELSGSFAWATDFQSIFDPSDSPPNLALDPLRDLQEGHLAFGRGDLTSARAHWEQARVRADAQGNEELAYLASGVIAVVLAEQGDLPGALTAITRAVDGLEGVGAGIKAPALLASMMDGDRMSLYNALISIQLGLRDAAGSFLSTERARAQAFLLWLGKEPVGPPPNVAHQSLVREAETKRRELVQLEATLARERAATRRRPLEEAIDHTRLELEGLLMRLEATGSEYAAVVDVRLPELRDIQATIDSDSQLVSYFHVKDYWLAWIVDRTRVQVVMLPVTPADLELIRRFGSALSERTRSAARLRPVEQQRLRDDSARLFDTFVAPLQPHLTAPKLILVPHGELHLLPFAALFDTKRNRYLVEDYALVHAPSASVLHHLQAKESPLEGGALVLGAPRRDGGEAALPGAEKEARAVAELFGVHPHIGGDATEDRLRNPGKVDLIHVASHAEIASPAPRLSRLLLAKGAGHDGDLEVHELFSGVDWSGVNLVVLSACETAVGQRTRGDEIVGLTRGALYAGSPGVLSTLWPISDEATETFISAFYDRLLAGAPAGVALQLAQQEMLRHDETADPHVWAAFTLHGDPRARWSEPLRADAPRPAEDGSAESAGLRRSARNPDPS